MTFGKKAFWGLVVFMAVVAVDSVPVDAANIFLSRNPSKQADPLKPEQEDVIDLLDDEPTDDAPAPPPESIDDFANRYYENCLKQENETLKGENLEMMCGCTSAQIPQNMTVEQMRAMQDNTDEGKLQRSRMLLFVYTPCIKYPTKALVTEKCLNNPDVRKTMRNYRAVCGCLGDKMADYMDREAPRAMEQALKRDMTDIDPLRALMESRGFDDYSRYYMNKCLNEHELGNRR